MRIIIFKFLILSFTLSNLSIAYADEKKLVRSEIEVYGNVKFLQRISPEEKFQVLVYKEEEQKAACQVDAHTTSDALKAVLRKNNRLSEKDTGNQFRVDFDYFVDRDQNGHCILGYEIYITRNIKHSNQLTTLFEGRYDYENSNPLLKLNGILHADEKELNPSLNKEVLKGTQLLIDALNDLTTKLKKYRVEEN